MTLTEFLLERIAEDEANAQRIGYDRHVAAMVGGSFAVDHPLRLLAECEAKVEIVKLHRPSRDTPGPEWEPYCEGCWEEGGMDGAPSYPCRTARYLALPYADHPDYREEWKP